MEEWRALKGFDGCYVSNLGRIRSHKGHILTAGINTHGYLQVKVGKKEQQKIIRIHRAIAEAFIPNPENKPYINHKDGNKLNNSIDNLEWCTPSENILHSIYVLGENKRSQIDNLVHITKKVMCIETKEIFNSIKEASNNRSEACNISRCCKGLRKTCRGYHWKFID